MVWQVATLPILCYIVRRITTMSVPLSYAAPVCGAVIVRCHGDSNLHK